MADVLRVQTVEVDSVNGSQANGPKVQVGGHPFNVQVTLAPAALGIIEVSNDGNTWVVDTGTLGLSLTAVTTRPKWARFAVATDAGGPRKFQAIFAIFKEE